MMMMVVVMMFGGTVWVIGLACIVYDTRCDFNVRSKGDISQLIYRTEPTTKVEKREKLKRKNG